MYVFRWAMLFIAFHILLVVVTPLISVNSLLYPLRIDSTYVAQMQNAGDSSFFGQPTHPKQIGINYHRITFGRTGEPVLQGWMLFDSSKVTAPMICIIPDISESKVCYVQDMMEFHARGFHVCVIDMRGQGDSEGDYYDPGHQSAFDLTALTQRLESLEQVEYVACLGIGTGAGICIKATEDTSFSAAALILQNTPESLEKLFHKTMTNEWGPLIYTFMPIVQRSYERSVQLDFHKHRYARIMAKTNLPFLSVAAGFVTESMLDDIRAVHEAGPFAKKKMFFEVQPDPPGLFHTYSRKYYDQICGFIISSRQSPVFKSRIKKLATE